MEIFPSLISSNLLNLETTIKLLDSVCTGYHIDVMDDHFVPNLTWGPAFVNAIIKATKLPVHVHLMVDNPEIWLDRLTLRPIDLFIFHTEALEFSQEIYDLIIAVKEKGWRVGLSIKPKTSVDKTFAYLRDIDHVLIMSVEPGFSGQEFIPEVVKKIEILVKKREEVNKQILTEKKYPVQEVLAEEQFFIGIDGGINHQNIKMLADKGVQQFAVAAAIFSEKDFVGALKRLD